MNTLRIISDKSRYVVAALLVAFSVLVPALASAAQLTNRSIEMSTSTKGATANYNIQFTATTGAGSAVIDFCDNSPLLGQSCNTTGALAGFSLTSATVGGGFTKDATSTATKLVVTGTISSGTVTIPVTNVTNPSAAGSIYARIVTYSGTDATTYTSTAPGAHADDGSVALSITEGIAVSGDVLETLSFCVSATDPTANCGGTTSPTLKLGETSGGVTALQAGTVSSGSLYTQISTNAVNGAVVRLKSNASDCGGLVRAGATSNAAGCGILPALNTDVTASGGAKFGVKTNTAAAASGATNANGVLQPFDTGGSPYYGNSAYALRYVAGNASGVTSVYGDEFLDTNNAPVNNQNMKLDFGATISNDTPAGSYSAGLSLIATGKF